jgi:hypothetical protein
MELSHQTAQAEKHLFEILDAIEAELLQLRRERDELRRALEPGGEASSSGTGEKPGRGSVKKAAKRTTKKKVAARKGKGAPRISASERAEPPAEPKASPRGRPALGRTLTQIRAPRV